MLINLINALVSLRSGVLLPQWWWYTEEYHNITVTVNCTRQKPMLTLHSIQAFQSCTAETWLCLSLFSIGFKSKTFFQMNLVYIIINTPIWCVVIFLLLLSNPALNRRPPAVSSQWQLSDHQYQPCRRGRRARWKPCCRQRLCLWTNTKADKLWSAQVSEPGKQTRVTSFILHPVRAKDIFPSSHFSLIKLVRVVHGWLVNLREIARRWRLSWWPPPGNPSRNPPAPVWVPAAPRQVYGSAGRLKWSPPESADTWEREERAKKTWRTSNRLSILCNLTAEQREGRFSGIPPTIKKSQHNKGGEKTDKKKTQRNLEEFHFVSKRWAQKKKQTTRRDRVSGPGTRLSSRH